jgi:hypothetical protein
MELWLKSYFDRGTLDFDRVRCDPRFGVATQLAGTNVILPPMPRARDNVPIQISFTQRSTLMETDILEGVDGTGNVKDGYRSLTSFDRLAVSRLKVRQISYGYEFRHISSFCKLAQQSQIKIWGASFAAQIQLYDFGNLRRNQDTYKCSSPFVPAL